MIIKRIMCDFFRIIPLMILLTHSASDTEARPQFADQQPQVHPYNQQQERAEDVFHPEPSVHHFTSGYPQHNRPSYYSHPFGGYNFPLQYNEELFFAPARSAKREKQPLQLDEREWLNEDPENHLIDSFMTAVIDGRLRYTRKPSTHPTRMHTTSSSTTTPKTTTAKDPKTPVKITLLPFYGGAKGQTLQVIENVDGSVSTKVIESVLPSIEPEEEIVVNPVLPVRRESDYGQNIKNIHKSALNILRLQESAKNKGLNQEEEAAYKEYMESLNQSAHNLAKIYEGDDEDDIDPSTRAGLSGWFARKKTTKKESSNTKDKDKKKEEEEKKKQQLVDAENKKKEEEAKKKAEEAKKKASEEAKKKADAEAKRKAEEAAKKKAEEDKKRKEEEDKRKQEQLPQTDEEEPAEPPETSVAEAKPVGLAVAGIGGVASSKPVATAVVGPGGLAIARPVGTAIAGVSPDQSLVPIYAEGYLMPKPSASKDKKPSHSSDYLNKIISKYHQA